MEFSDVDLKKTVTRRMGKEYAGSSRKELQVANI